MITVTLDQRGNLVLTADDEAREALRAETDYSRREGMIRDELEGKYEFIAPEWIGALTSAPILCHVGDVTVQDDGTRAFGDNARIYWFPNYAITDEWQELADRGTVTFDKAPE